MLLPFLLPACEQRPDGPAAGPAKMQVFATTLPLADLARRVGGEDVDVAWGAEAGRPVSPVRPPADRAALVTTADLVITGGDAPWAFAGFDDPLRAGRIVRIDTLPEAAARGQEGFGGGYLDPAVADAVAGEIAARLATIRPDRAAVYRQNAAVAGAEIDAATAALVPSTGPTGGGRAVVVFSDAFVPVLRAGGFKPAASDASPTDWGEAAVARTRQVAAASGATVAAVPADLTAAALAEFMRRTGLRPVRFDALGSSAAGGRGSLAAVLAYDVAQLGALADKPDGPDNPKKAPASRTAR